jgi:hypothetical protein
MQNDHQNIIITPKLLHNVQNNLKGDYLIDIIS